MDDRSDPSARLRESVRSLIRQGRIEAALGEVHEGTATERHLAEELRIYQAELELQNEQLRLAEADASAAHDRFRQLFQLHPEPVLLLDEQGRILECNDAASRLFGIGSLLDHHLYFSQRLGAAWRGAFLRSLSDASAGGMQQVNQAALALDEGETAATWDVRLCGARGPDGRPAHCIVVLIDQSRLLLRQDELRQRVDQQARELSDAHHQSMSVATAHARVAASLVSELQTPLNRLLRFVRALHDAPGAAIDPSGAQARSQLDAIMESANTLQRIVSDLALAVQSESGTLQPRPSRTDLARLVRDACTTEAWAANRGVQVDVACGAEPMYVAADASLVDHVLRNLIRRAVMRAARGDHVQVSLTRAEADAERRARAVVEITCAGSGHEHGDLERLFSLFATAHGEDRETAADHLAMLSCRVMVELHGGRIGARRLPNGTRFDFWIPA